MHVLSQVNAINFANEQPHRHWKLVRYDGPSRRAVFCCASESCFLVAEGVTRWRYAHPWQSVHFDLRPVYDPAEALPIGRAPSSEPPRRYWLDITADASGDGVRSEFACGGSVLLYQSEALRNDLALACLAAKFEYWGNLRDERKNTAAAAGALNELLTGSRVRTVRVVAYAGEFNSYDELLLKVETVQLQHLQRLDWDEIPPVGSVPPPTPASSWWIVCRGLHQCALQVNMPADSLALGRADLLGSDVEGILPDVRDYKKVLVIGYGDRNGSDNGGVQFVAANQIFIHKAKVEDPTLPIDGPRTKEKMLRLSDFGNMPVWRDGPPLNQL